MLYISKITVLLLSSILISCGTWEQPCDSTNTTVEYQDFEGWYHFKSVGLTEYDVPYPNSVETVHPEYDQLPTCDISMKLTSGGLVSKAYYECPFELHYMNYSEYDLPLLQPLQLKKENGITYVKFPYFETQWWVTDFPLTTDTYIAVVYPTSYLGDYRYKNFELMQRDALSGYSDSETKLSDSSWIAVEKENCKLRFESLCQSESDCNEGYPIHSN